MKRLSFLTLLGTILCSSVAVPVAAAQKPTFFSNVTIFNGSDSITRSNVLASEGIIIVSAIDAAKRIDKLSVAHVSTASAAEQAVDADIDGLVHLFCESKIEPSLLEKLKQKGVFVVPTAAVISNAAKRNTTKTIIEDDSINALHEAGVPVLAGSDAPNPGTIHGASIHHELRLLVEAGLTPTEAIAAATLIPARYFGLNDRGQIAVGKRADLLLVDGDPTLDIRALSKLAGVWKHGYAVERTPE
jgi:imidazolonepropionase-like amidohydrolase